MHYLNDGLMLSRDHEYGIASRTLISGCYFFFQMIFRKQIMGRNATKNVLAFWLKIPIHLWLFIAAQWSIFALGIDQQRGKKNTKKKNNSAFMKKSNTIQLLSHSYQAPNEMTLEDLIEWTNEEKNETKTTEIIIIYTKQKVRGREKERTNTATPNRGITGPFSIGLKKRRFAFFLYARPVHLARVFCNNFIFPFRFICTNMALSAILTSSTTALYF